MVKATTTAADVGSVRALRTSFLRTLAAENKSPKTVEAYGDACRFFADYLERTGMPTEVARLRREHVEAWMQELLDTRSPATANNRYRGLHAFFKWCVEEGEITQSPMKNMKPPAIPETPVPVINEDGLRRLLRACEGTGFEERRDLALVRLLIDTGMRLAEIEGLTVDDIDLDLNVAIIGQTAKFRRPRTTPFGKRTALALDRYLRARASHKHADRPELWLGQTGGVGQDRRDEDPQEARGRRRPRRDPPAHVPAHLRP